jgi:dTDP-4-dehydrorhamnose reductase
VDLCETDRDAARRINALGPKEVASASRKAGSKIIYISTDYVFDGLQGNYREQDAPSPLNYYGESKLAGERFVQEACPECLILRTSVLYGWNPTRLNFVTWAVSELQKGRSINVVTDQHNSPTYSSDLAGMILRLKDEQGVFHASGRERISRYGFTLKVAEAFGLDSSLINPVTSGELRWTAPRPADSSLNVSKVSGIAGPLNVDEGLKQMKSQKEARLQNEAKI